MDNIYPSNSERAEQYNPGEPWENDRLQPDAETIADWASSRVFDHVRHNERDKHEHEHELDQRSITVYPSVNEEHMSAGVSLFLDGLHIVVMPNVARALAAEIEKQATICEGLIRGWRIYSRMNELAVEKWSEVAEPGEGNAPTLDAKFIRKTVHDIVCGCDGHHRTFDVLTHGELDDAEDAED